MPGISRWELSKTAMSPASSASKSGMWAGDSSALRQLTARSSSAARGAGSMQTCSACAPASANARARNRVEWPEPTSTMRLGGALRASA